MTSKPSRITDLRKTPVEKGGDKWTEGLALESRGNLLWEHADAEDLLAAVAAVTEDGAALLLSKTSDGGALCIQVWSGQGRHKLYPAVMAELTEALALITDLATRR